MTGQWLKTARKETGLSLEDATFRLRSVLPEGLQVSSATVRRAELRADPDPVLAAVLAIEVYGKRAKDLPPPLAHQLSAVTELLVRCRSNQPHSVMLLNAACSGFAMEPELVGADA